MKFEFKIEPRDVWIGVFWDRREDGFHVYFCPFFCVLFHWTFEKNDTRPL